MLLGIIFVDLYGVIIKYLGEVYPMMQMTLFRNIFAIIPLMILFAEPINYEMNLTAISALFYLGIIPTGLAFSLRQILIRTAGTTFMMQVAYLIPVFGIFYGWALMNEPLKFSLLIGVILVVIGIAISRLQVESNTGI